VLDSIDPERNMGHRASTEQLLEVAHAGQHLFRSAIIEAAEANDTAFFVELFEEEREEVNTVLQGFGYDTRCSECGGILPHTGECARS
jgi:hypothetical protein